jgi:hypothetical protein
LLSHQRGFGRATLQCREAELRGWKSFSIEIGLVIDSDQCPGLTAFGCIVPPAIASALKRRCNVVIKGPPTHHISYHCTLGEESDLIDSYNRLDDLNVFHVEFPFSLGTKCLTGRSPGLTFVSGYDTPN